jgi:hypothetical protein
MLLGNSWENQAPAENERPLALSEETSSPDKSNTECCSKLPEFQFLVKSSCNAPAFGVSTFCNDKYVSGGVDAIVAYGTDSDFGR